LFLLGEIMLPRFPVCWTARNCYLVICFLL